MSVSDSSPSRSRELHALFRERLARRWGARLGRAYALSGSVALGALAGFLVARGAGDVADVALARGLEGLFLVAGGLRAVSLAGGLARRDVGLEALARARGLAGTPLRPFEAALRCLARPMLECAAIPCLALAVMSAAPGGAIRLVQACLLLLTALFAAAGFAAIAWFCSRLVPGAPRLAAVMALAVPELLYPVVPGVGLPSALHELIGGAVRVGGP